jgi:GNAT superfamily N-acetyltransferase
MNRVEENLAGVATWDDAWRSLRCRRRVVDLVASAGFVVGEEDGTAWMDAEERPDVTPLPEGFVLVDRALETTRPHPMRHRNGEAVEARLRQCSLYDPALDLAAETADGQVGGYALFWFDPVTRVGMLEPMRVEDEYQRRGLGRAMLTAGLDRLASRAARHLKSQLRHRRGAFALRRRGLPRDLHQHVASLEETAVTGRGG